MKEKTQSNEKKNNEIYKMTIIILIYLSRQYRIKNNNEKITVIRNDLIQII